MITCREFVDAVLDNAETVTEYQNGGSGNGPCDCIGLIIGALARLGVKWPGTHGTNWTARNYVQGMSDVLGLRVGDVLFKVRQPCDAGYSLPDTYKDSNDKLDYYHIGVVTAVNPLEITHCTTVPGGIKIDTTLGNWRYKALLKCVYEGSEKKMQKGLVIADSGKTVNLREKPSKTSKVLMAVPVGTEVDILEEGETWSNVQYKDMTGYMMSQFIIPVANFDFPVDDTQEKPNDESAITGKVNVTLNESTALLLLDSLPEIINSLQAIYDELDEQLGKG